jgi:hypothetical protein
METLQYVVQEKQRAVDDAKNTFGGCKNVSVNVSGWFGGWVGGGGLQAEGGKGDLSSSRGCGGSSSGGGGGGWRCNCKVVPTALHYGMAFQSAVGDAKQKSGGCTNLCVNARGAGGVPKLFDARDCVSCRCQYSGIH